MDKVTLTPEALEHLNKYTPHVLVSAVQPDQQGLKPLIDYLHEWKSPQDEPSALQEQVA
jgi:hypothetical protein